MPLPKISAPTFDVVQPSTQTPLMVRPFVVKEEKILLMAKESGERKDIFNAVRQIVGNCVITEGWDVNDCTIYDLEYIFLKLRAISIDNMVKFQVQDSSDGIQYDLEVDLNEVEVHFPEGYDKNVKINDEVGLILKPLSPDVTERLTGLDSLTDLTYETVKSSIDQVYDEEEVYPWREVSDSEQDEFLDALPLEAFKQIEKFFAATPGIRHVVEYENSKGEVRKVIFRNLDDFFTLY